MHSCGKIKGCMNTENLVKSQKPSILQAFISGFNTTTNHIYLILLPVFIDLFIWFGPQFSFEKLLLPRIQEISSLPGVDNSQFNDIMADYIANLTELVKNLNLSVIIRTIPVGVPSLISSLSPTKNPIGTPIRFEISSINTLFVYIIAFSLIGIVLGSLFYQRSAQSVMKDYRKPSLSEFLIATLQVILLPVLLLIIFLMISAPILMFVSLLSIISPAIGQFALMSAMVIILWMIIPLYFTPQSIFLFKQNLFNSIMTSISVVRFSLPGSALFLLFAMVLSEGFNILWRVPPQDSWMLLVGILGHAFFSTAILLSSFYYLLDAAQFAQQILIKQKDQIQKKML